MQTSPAISRPLHFGWLAIACGEAVTMATIKVATENDLRFIIELPKS
jgi:hypothetical protein